MNGIVKLKNPQHHNQIKTPSLSSAKKINDKKMFIFDGDPNYAEINERMKTYQPPTPQPHHD